jgi:hypothetical protein
MHLKNRIQAETNRRPDYSNNTKNSMKMKERRVGRLEGFIGGVGISGIMYMLALGFITGDSNPILTKKDLNHDRIIEVIVEYRLSNRQQKKYILYLDDVNGITGIEEYLDSQNHLETKPIQNDPSL